MLRRLARRLARERGEGVARRPHREMTAGVHGQLLEVGNRDSRIVVSFAGRGNRRSLATGMTAAYLRLDVEVTTGASACPAPDEEMTCATDSICPRAAGPLPPTRSR